MSRAPIRLAVMAFNVPSAFVPQGTKDVGGIETQYRALIERFGRTLDVTLIGKLPHAPPSFPAGLGFHPIQPPTEGSKLRRFLKNGSQTVRAILQANPDVVLQTGAGAATFFAWIASRLRRAPFVFHWASDADANGSLLAGSRFLQILAVFARRRAQLQICQTEHQMTLLSSRERANAMVIPNVVPDSIRPGSNSGHEVLWLANIRAIKRPDRFIALARAMPERRFRMIGALLEGPEFQERIRSAIAACPNILYVGAVPSEELPQHLRKARCLVNTSDVEGFPATFLEACAAGVPVVSLHFDPGRMLSRDGAGIHLAGDEEKLVSAVEIMYDPFRWSAFQEGCRQVAERHGVDAVAERWIGLFREALDQRR